MVDRVCEMKPSLPTGPKKAPKFPDCALKLPTPVFPGLRLPDWVHPVKSPVSKPQLVTKLPAIASHSLGTAWTADIVPMQTASPRQTVNHVKRRCTILPSSDHV